MTISSLASSPAANFIIETVHESPERLGFYKRYVDPFAGAAQYSLCSRLSMSWAPPVAGQDNPWLTLTAVLNRAHPDQQALLEALLESVPSINLSKMDDIPITLATVRGLADVRAAVEILSAVPAIDKEMIEALEAGIGHFCALTAQPAAQPAHPDEPDAYRGPLPPSN